MEVYLSYWMLILGVNVLLGLVLYYRGYKVDNEMTRGGYLEGIYTTVYMVVFVVITLLIWLVYFIVN